MFKSILENLREMLDRFDSTLDIFQSSFWTQRLAIGGWPSDPDIN